MAVRPWGDDELAALAEHYPHHGSSWDGWADALPGRSERSIAVKASVLGLRVSAAARSAHHRAAAMKREAARRAANGVQNGTPGKAPGMGAETRR
ncbi:MAG: hypothetical protein IKF14_02240 [Atopobiaceae bacterium]|nr:hypothetical protein [Atopobiaceae bacterium]